MMKKETYPTILLIDDDSSARQATANYLRGCHYSVSEAGSGREGIDACSRLHPDLIICDLTLPDMDGFATLAEIQQESPEMPIIVLADKKSTNDAIKAIRLGVSDFLLKPISDLEILGLSVGNTLKRSALLSENSRYRKKLEVINRELENTVEIFKQDQQAGRHVQMSMLPKTPLDIAGYHFSHSVLPSLYLSGDSVDYKPIAKTKVMFYIADVSGHGSSSAFITVLLRFRIEQMRREYIRSRFMEDFSPAPLLAVLNRDLLDSGLDKHITMFIGVLDHADNSLLYGVAGHYPLPVLYNDGKAGFLAIRKSSLPIGLSAEAEYFEEKIKLNEKFSLTLFSDGIMEILDRKPLQNREDTLLLLVEESEGKLEKIKTGLDLDNIGNVPDDIAIMSVSG
ncbi:MAG: response regulator [Pseudomonadales bacterium]|nr:response regulator [Pseudomonadales bacterium]